MAEPRFVRDQRSLVALRADTEGPVPDWRRECLLERWRGCRLGVAKGAVIDHHESKPLINARLMTLGCVELWPSAIYFLFGQLLDSHVIWKNSKMTTLYYDTAAADEKHPCVVKIGDSDILVEYRGETEELVQYRGKNDGSGHFELQAESVSGRGTLHMFLGSSHLEGSWIERGARGMWRIELA
ncbi:MAG: hypothetical protein R3F15_18340 [Lysobacterales bacterium]